MSQALSSLIQREWQYQLEHSPVYASLMGDHRYDDRWDDLSLAGLEADDRHGLAVLEELRGIDRDGLSAEDRLNYDLFRRDYQLWTEEYARKQHLVPTTHLSWLPEQLRQRPGIQSAYQLADQLRFETVKDYENWIARLRAFRTLVDQIIASMREGARERLVPPRIVLQRIPAQIEKQLVDDPARSDFFGPFTRFPASIAGADRTRLCAEGLDAVAKGVQPAMRHFLQFLNEEYLPAGPTDVGIGHWPDGAGTYAFLARKYTTTAFTPDEIHAMGLAEVARIRNDMETVKQKTGFSGSLHEFFHFLRTDPRFYCTTGEELLLQSRNLAKRIDPLLVKLFKTFPRQPYGVEPTPEAMAPDATTGFYFPAAADGSRAGLYYVNLYKPETRPRWEMVPLTLHEAVPGHHFQTQLAAEQRGIPEFRRYGFHVAYGEGWALYAETLGDELGLYDDPYDKFGQLVFDIFRAVRLVVDTGLHVKGWSRKQAIDYFLENTPRPELDITNEVDRYIAMPGQALGYKIGQLKFRELRSRAERALGQRFDVRAFHDVVLLEGSVTLDILEQRIDAWIAQA